VAHGDVEVGTSTADNRHEHVRLEHHQSARQVLRWTGRVVGMLVLCAALVVWTSMNDGGGTHDHLRSQPSPATSPVALHPPWAADAAAAAASGGEEGRYLADVAATRSSSGAVGESPELLGSERPKDCGRYIMLKYGCSEYACTDRKVGYINYLYVGPVPAPLVSLSMPVRC